MQTIKGIPEHEVLDAFCEAAEEFLFEVASGKPAPAEHNVTGLGWYFVSPGGPVGPYCSKTQAQRGLIDDMLAQTETIL